MNILEVIPSVDAASGGPIEWTRQFATAALREGHNVEMASLDAPDAPCVRAFPLAVHACGPAKGLPYGYTPHFVPWMRRNASRYDAVVVNGIWAYHSFGAWRALRNSRTPYFVFTHGMLDPWFKRRYPLKHLKKWLYWPWAEYRVLRDASAVLFTCEEEKILARKSFWLYSANEVTVGNGTSAPTGEAEAQIEAFFLRSPAARGKRIALFMGRIHPKKGCDLILDAFARILGSDPAWHLVIAGPDDGGWQRELMGQSADLGGRGPIAWPGMLTGDEKWGAMRAAEIFLLPSHQENFGLAVAEALACGVPALISSKVNIWREVQQDGAGIVAADDLEGTCAMLREWAGLTLEQRTRMRERAHGCFLQRFEIGKISHSLLELLASTGSDRRVLRDTRNQATLAGA